MGAGKGNQRAAGTRSRPDPAARPFPLCRPDTPARTHGGTTALYEARELPTHAADPDRATRPLRELTAPDLPPGSSVAEVRRAWRDELVTSLGGADNLSAQQAWLVETTTNTYLMVRYLDAWLLQRSSLFVSEKRGTLLPVVLHRSALANTLTKQLGLLGLARRAREVESLEGYLARRASGEGK